MRIAGTLGLALLLAAAPARADEPAPKPVKVDVGVGTGFPLDLGVSGHVELPARILAGLEVGWMPKPYAYTIDDLLKGFGAYNDTVSQLIREAISNSLVIRPSVGWRPFSKLGLEFLVGYTLLTIGGGLDGREIVEAATGKQLPTEAPNQIPLHSTLHNFHIRAGYRFLLGEHWVLRASLDYVHCFASSSGIDVTARTAAGQKAVSAVNDEIDSYLNGYYTKYVNAPVLGVNLAYRF